jgi:hypothetical protein
MKFIRKGTGRPFLGDQFDTKDLASLERLPGFRARMFYILVNVEVRTSADDTPHRLLNANQRVASVVAGNDAQGRPSFLTVEHFGDDPVWGRGVYSFTEETEQHISRYDLEQSRNYTEDLAKEYYIAQWSLVAPAVRKGVRRTPPLYELSSTYALSVYRSEGHTHLCLGRATYRARRQ